MKPKQSDIIAWLLMSLGVGSLLAIVVKFLRFS